MTSHSDTPHTTSTSDPTTTTTMTEKDKMLAGLPYNAMTDPALQSARLRVRRLFQKYNAYPWPEPDSGVDYFGPDERMQLVADIFGMTLEEVKGRPVEIEPPCYFDYVSDRVVAE